MTLLFVLSSCTSTATFAPVADAGADQQVLLGEPVSLDGTNSHDLDGTVESWSWRLVLAPRGSTTSLTDAEGAGLTLTPDLAGVYVVALQVTDDQGEVSALDLANITVGSGNAAPTVELTASATDVVPRALVALTASGRDPEGEALSWEWSVQAAPAATEATIEGGDTEASFVPDVGGVYVLGVRATDGTSWSQRADVVVSVDSPDENDPPVARCSAPEDDVEVGVSAALDGTGSVDPEGAPLGYAWALAERPNGSRAYLEDASEPVAALVPDVEGTYRFKLQVSDGETASESCETSFRAVDAPPTLCEQALIVDHLDDATVGEATGGTWAGGRFFGGLDTSGGGALRWSPDLGASWTVAWWMRTDPDTREHIVLAGDAWELVRSEEELRLEELSADASLGDGSWSAYALRWDGAEASVYQDGERLFSGAAGLEGTTTLQLGSRYDTGLTGAIDEVMVWARALTDEEIVETASSAAQPCTGDVDASAPTLSVTSPTTDTETSAGWVAVTGTTSDASDVAWVSVNGVDALATSPGFSEWIAWVAVDSAGTSLQVEAEDVAGHSRVLTGATVSEAPRCYPDASLVLRFDEVAPGEAVDTSSSQQALTDELGGRTLGRFGNAALHEGGPGLRADDLVPDQFTASAWVLQTDASPAAEVLGQAGRFGMGFAAYRPACTGYTESGTSVVVVGPTSPRGRWMHLACRYDGVELAIAVDGIVHDSTEVALAVVDSPLDVAANPDLPWYGLIDQLVVYEDAEDDDALAAQVADADPCDTLTNTAVAATASATLEPTSPDLALDGLALEIALTSWHAPDAGTASLTLELDGLVGVTEVRWSNTNGNPSTPRATADYAVWASTTGAFDGEETLLLDGAGVLDDQQRWTFDAVEAPVPASHVRFDVLGWHGHGGGLAEIHVLGVEP